IVAPSTGQIGRVAGGLPPWPGRESTRSPGSCLAPTDPTARGRRRLQRDREPIPADVVLADRLLTLLTLSLLTVDLPPRRSASDPLSAHRHRRHFSPRSLRSPDARRGPQGAAAF